MIAEFEANPRQVITLDQYRDLDRHLEWFDRAFIEEALEKHGYLVAMATTERGEVVPAHIGVATQIGKSIALAKNSQGEWTFSTSRETWEHPAGRSGIAVVEDCVVVDVLVTAMN